MAEHQDREGAARVAATRERRIAEYEAEQAELEWATARSTSEPWVRSAHRLAAEIHHSAADAHRRAAAQFEATEHAEHARARGETTR